MKHSVTISLFTLALGIAAFGQTTAPATFDPSASKLPGCTDSNGNATPCPAPKFFAQVVGVNAAFCETCETQFKGGVWYAKRMTDNNHPTYWYNAITIDRVALDPVTKRIAIQTTPETGTVQHVQRFGRWDVYALAAGGLAMAADSKGLALAGGGMANTKVGKSLLFGVFSRADHSAIAAGIGWQIGLTVGLGSN